ncbi:MAG: phage tail protein [Paraburkholderia sp.]|uniref:phage tail protein n=1 Tax=Paraburkholderia sp. TaxID=1926495 RepID=UPI0012059952|nr:phage tail protein [Paraburkholderia sp.]TAM05620.1 MAG: phage tail protein [Paraburkholderia sp.]
MFALLGDIQFDLIGYFDGFESTFGANYAEHGLIHGKPRLQRVGDNLDEIRVALSFHFKYCDPEAELLKLRTALAARQAMALVFGNGDYKGWFVLTTVEATSKQTDASGTVMALEANITLREFAGDKKRPLNPPAVKPKVPPVAAKAVARAPSAVKSAANTVRKIVQQGVAYANQARTAIRIATDTVQAAKRLTHDPAGALEQIGGIVGDLQRASGPLAKIGSALAPLAESIPDAVSVIRSSSTALGSIRAAQHSLASANFGNITQVLDTTLSNLTNATDAFSNAEPAISRLAARVITRAD